MRVFLKVLFRRQRDKLARMQVLPRSIERSTDRGDFVAARQERLQQIGHYWLQAIYLGSQLPSFSFTFEHSRRKIVALPTLNPPVGMKNRAVDRHDCRARPRT